ncbi:DEAD/DEAH box helicase [Candidatus Contendibacter odensensis]|uniref:Helicase, C-terminal:Type III restriction enzyme, res subunit:DEAD/DEAH box helicase n=1 Tax=Candidatus Contendobacter odensis Run_B_J11 TaxID=1400861 RepID=A0A7U7GEP9_9GAMM|nr:DEAD/DEAH box helicase [Candidatus Contendobacter odensis]CDH46991.1 putative Helicase, C-terminal:Type III restriction enzyme, res subunit:DEAD/DEAH box helicase [Candidatus Contendobacter odensis Run_B_J11]
MILRPYQQEAIQSVCDYVDAGNPGNPLVVAPTGSGKSLLQAGIIQQFLDTGKAKRVICLAHVKELIQQNLDKMIKIWPEAHVGAYSAGLGKSDTRRAILFCGIQSVWNKARKLASTTQPIDVVFIDECHRVPFIEGGTYRRFIDDLTALNPKLRVIGLTATPYRYVPGTKTHTGGYQSLIVGENRIFTDIVYDLSRSLVSLIQDDYLAALWPTPTQYRVNLKGVRIENGDYKADQLNALMGSADVINAILDAAIPLAQADDRKHWLVFCTGVEGAKSTAQNLRDRGISAVVVTGETSARDRETAIREFQAGQVTALVSVNTLTTGFDAPLTDCLIVARPTLSPVMHVQLLGRGMRPTDEKISQEDGIRRGCLVLDFVGNIERHGPIDCLKLKGPSVKKQEPTKECPACHAVIRIFASVCPECGYEFPAREPEPIQPPSANQSAIIAGISDMKPPVRYAVTRVAYSKHTSGKSGIPTLRVDYYDGFFRLASEWVCLDHPKGTYPRKKAETWWKERMPKVVSMLPGGVDQAMDWIKTGYTLNAPEFITLRTAAEKSYPEIVRYEWPDAPHPALTHPLYRQPENHHVPLATHP